MAMREIAGTVEDIKLEKREELLRSYGSGHEAPMVVKATLVLADGRRAYVTTQVATWHWFAGIGPCGSEGIFPTPSQERAAHPWFVKDDHMALPEPGTLGHKNGIAYGYDSATLTVWAGDVVTVRGTVEEKTSKQGTGYLCVKRASVTAWNRPEWAATEGVAA
jgi:acyl dehydratase